MQLKHSKIITPRGSVGTSSGVSIDYSYFDPSKRTLAGETISRNIQWYRMWWTYLRLALELEGLNHKIDGQKVKVNKRVYRAWSVHSILESSFDRWWKEHKGLFVVESIKKASDSSAFDDDHLVMMIPKNRDKTSILLELDKLLEGKVKSVEKFPFSSSKATYLRLHMQYNIFIKSLMGERRELIRRWVNEKYEPMGKVGIVGGLLQNKVDNQGERITEIISAENGITNNVRYAKKRIISVGQGVFP